MQRIFRHWAKSEEGTLSLQEVVSGFAAVKGSKDIMTNIQYFFELYDDDNDGRVDREGILSISEALLFLTRRGLDDGRTPTTSTNNLAQGLDPDDPEKNAEEAILNSISAFIRRCFEYADPDHEINKGQEAQKNPADDFSIGDEDDEENLLEMDDDKPAPKPKPAVDIPAPQAKEDEAFETPLSPRAADATRANLALDPAHPLHITLPTFRMVILADETLEHFFDRAFANSFRLSDLPPSVGANTLTTFANAGRTPSTPSSATAGVGSLPSIPSTGGIVPPGKGLRGMLDNIVSDGMRVAAEVKRRMDEAQREMEHANNGQASSRAGGEGDDDEEEDDGGRFRAETRSLHERDRDLLEGTETEDIEERVAAAAREEQQARQSQTENLMDVEVGEGGSGGGGGAGAHLEALRPARERGASDASGRVVEFDRGSTL